MTNFGMSGILLGTLIIRYGEVAIVGVGAINKKVVALEDDTMAIRSMMYLTLTFDHRVLDGMYGCGYLAAIIPIVIESFPLHAKNRCETRIQPAFSRSPQEDC